MKYLLTSRKFWAALIGLLVIVLAAFVTGFEIDQERGASLAVVVVSYIIGVAVDPGPGGWKGVIQSRKFWAALVGLIMVLLTGFGIKLPLMISEEQLVEIALVIGAYISGVAIEGRVSPYQADAHNVAG